MTLSRRASAKRISLTAAAAVVAAIALLALLAPLLSHVAACSPLAVGARSSLSVVVPAIAISQLIGIPLGLLAARVGRLGDRIVTRGLEIAGGFPSIILVALLRATAPDAPTLYAAAILALVRIPQTVRLVRLHAVRYRTSELYVATRALGASSTRILLRHLLPSMAGALASAALMGAGILVGIEAAMTFVGLGAPAQDTTWGAQIGYAVASGNLPSALLPVTTVALTMVACYRLAEGVRRRFSVPAE